MEFLENRTLTMSLQAIKDYIHLMHDEAKLLDETIFHKQFSKSMKQTIIKEKKMLLNILAKRNYKLFKAREYVEDISGNTFCSFIIKI